MINYGTIIVPINCSKKDYTYLLSCNKLSAEVWNIVLDLEECHRKENEGEWLDRNQLQKLTKKCVPLHAKGIHHVVHKYLFARDSALKAKKGNGENNKYPHKKKQYFPTGWDVQSVKVNKNKLILSKPTIERDGKNYKQKPITLYVKSIPENIVEVELVYKKELMLAIKYKDKSEKLQIKSKNHASIDLGEIHSITSIDSCGNAIIITGRKMRAIKQHRNKIQADIYRRMSKCKKGSKQYRKYLRALKNMKWKYDKKILDCVHKVSKLYLDYCIINDVSTVYYGDLDSATRNTKKRANKFVGQKLNQWNYGELIKQLENKLTRYGIKLIEVKEYYTSQKCPSCESLNKPTKRNYTCKCGYRQHRDIVGAMNILNDNSEFEISRYTDKKYLQIT